MKSEISEDSLPAINKLSVIPELTLPSSNYLIFGYISPNKIPEYLLSNPAASCNQNCFSVFY
jgi:hypothetical protein